MLARFSPRGIAPLIAAFCAFMPSYAGAAEPATQNVVGGYADLVDLAESAPLILRATIQTSAKLEPARAGQVADGHARIYVEALGTDAYAGPAPGSLPLRYLADVPTDARGKVPNMKKQSVILFARPAPAQASAGSLQLVAPDGQQPWSPELEGRVRAVLAELAAPNAPPRVTGISMALYQEGDLAGEGETQIFLTTANAAPAAIVVQHRAGEPARWSASFSEVVDASGKPPARDTLAWYRLACALPRMLPAAANVGEQQSAKDQAQADYLLVLRDLGPCGRTRSGPPGQ